MHTEKEVNPLIPLIGLAADEAEEGLRDFEATITKSLARVFRDADAITKWSASASPAERAAALEEWERQAKTLERWQSEYAR